MRSLQGVSFSGGGFLGTYHLGAIDCFQKQAPKLLSSPSCILLGASAGSLIACSLAGDVCVQTSLGFFQKYSERVRSLRLGVLTPGYSLLDDIRQDIVDLYPSDIHKRANGKVVLVVTHEKDRSAHYINHFSTKDELVEACFASSYIPYLTGKSREVYRGATDYIDGGIVDNWPLLSGSMVKGFSDDIRLKPTIRISPFAGEFEVSPKHTGSGAATRISSQGHEFDLSQGNFEKMLKTMFPPSAEELQTIFEHGQGDAARFLSSYEEHTQ